MHTAGVCQLWDSCIGQGAREQKETQKPRFLYAEAAESGAARDCPLGTHGEWRILSLLYRNTI